MSANCLLGYAIGNSSSQSTHSLKSIDTKKIERCDRRHKLKSNPKRIKQLSRTTNVDARASRIDDPRTPFERDRDRVLYCSAFHRLAGITQVVQVGEVDVMHTRQQHSIKVAQIGRRLAQRLTQQQPDEASALGGVDPEVVEAACLAHDLGHPPFGHVGEYELDALVRNNGDTGGFEGNAQSFRVITKLSLRFDKIKGLNLTRSTLNACLKYPWIREERGIKSKKWSVYQSEIEDFKFARAGRSVSDERKSVEAEIMDWADDVAYSIHDIEDFHRCNEIPWYKIFDGQRDLLINGAMKSYFGSDKAQISERLRVAYQRLKDSFWAEYSEFLITPYDGRPDHREQLRRMTSELIARYMGSMSLPSLDEIKSGKVVNFIQDDVDEVRLLKQITRDYVIDNPTICAQQHGQKRIIREIFHELYQAAKTGKDSLRFIPMRLEPLYDLSKGSPARFAADCLASLTEREVVALHARLLGRHIGSVFDPIVR